MSRNSVFYPTAEVTIFTELGQLVLRSSLNPVESGDTSVVTDHAPVQNSTEVKKKEKKDENDTDKNDLVSLLSNATHNAVGKATELIEKGAQEVVRNIQKQIFTNVDKSG